MKVHAKVRTAIIAAVAFGAFGITALAPTVASAAPLIYYCEGNICMGDNNDSHEPVDVAVYADEYQFYGHFELQTPSHETFNSADTSWRTGTNNLHYFGEVDGHGEYCGTAWEKNAEGGYDKIGYICTDF